MLVRSLTAALLCAIPGSRPERAIQAPRRKWRRQRGTKISLMANGVQVHPLITKPAPVRPIEFDIPRQATRRGELDLSWNASPDSAGTGAAARYRKSG